MDQYFKEEGIIVLAHRGGAGEAPENSLEAFHRAYALGCRYLEIDVRADAEGTLYVCHNATSLLPNRPLRTDANAMPETLASVFDAFPDACFAIDPKHDLASEPLAELIVSYGYEDRVCIGSSFDRRTRRVVDAIVEMSGKRPAMALVGVSMIAGLLLTAARMGRYRPIADAQFVHVPAICITPRIVEAAHDLNMKIIAWVLNDERSIKKYLAMGVDGYMTDFPSRAFTATVSVDQMAGWKAR